ncbi:DUF4912 domain-containing protein [Endothiovibrio diazotrophicus]
MSKSNKASPVKRATPPKKPLSRKELRRISEVISANFPAPAEMTEVVLLPLSPHRLHAYWHITTGDLALIRGRLGDQAEGAALVLRFHDRAAARADHTPHPAFDIEVEGESGHRYVELWRDSGRYSAQLGLRTRYGLLVEAARSDVAELPRAGRSERAGRRVLRLQEGPVGARPEPPSAPPRDPVVPPPLAAPIELPRGDRPPRGLPPEKELRTLAAPAAPLARRFPNPDDPGRIDSGPAVETNAEWWLKLIAAPSLPAEPRDHGPHLSMAPPTLGGHHPSSFTLVPSGSAHAQRSR